MCLSVKMGVLFGFIEEVGRSWGQKAIGSKECELTLRAMENDQKGDTMAFGF